MIDEESGEKPEPAVDEKPRTKASDPLPWEGKPEPDEVIRVLENRAYLEASRQRILVEIGMRKEPYHPAMREAYIMTWLANWFRGRLIEREKKNQYRR